MDTENDKPDAGLRSLDHYKVRLPGWRYHFREKLLPIVRWETPYLAWMQATMRTPALDTYFAISANLGTHTFFMIMLPILFWCGYTSLGRGMVHMLASGVFFSGFIKDMLCLPRPLSPPLQRITMSGSAALEYGFPSTHSTNAVSVAVYSIYFLNYGRPDISANINIALQVISYLYAISIITGRLYCGMHGFFDVIIGTILGAVLAIIQCLYGDLFDHYIHSGTGRLLFITILTILVLVRIHPEPVDDCPCFDDSVAFAGVMIGIEFGNWHFARTQYAWSLPCPGTVPFSLAEMGFMVTIARIVLGVVVIFAWRGIMKPTLLRMLPPVFRVIEALGLNLPRRFFKQASQYSRVPKQKDDDNIIPPVSKIPQLLTAFRRRRAVSIGPQSEADAYETMAYREKRRRDSLTSNGVLIPVVLSPTVERETSYFQPPPASSNNPGVTRRRSKSASIEEYRNMMGAGIAPPVPVPGASLPPPNTSVTGAESEAQKLEQKVLFSNLQKPRVRYDVEVITKLTVYAGIAWLAVEGNPILFQLIGLSV